MIKEIRPASNVITTREKLVKEIKEKASLLDGHNKATRSTWIAVGERLVQLKATCGGSLPAFGKLVVNTGLDKLPALATPASRSDAMWMVEHPEAASMVPMEVTNPRTIRHEWRKLMNAEAKLAVHDLVGIPDSDGKLLKAAAEKLALKLDGEEEAALTALEKAQAKVLGHTKEPEPVSIDAALEALGYALDTILEIKVEDRSAVAAKVAGIMKSWAKLYLEPANA